MQQNKNGFALLSILISLGIITAIIYLVYTGKFGNQKNMIETGEDAKNKAADVVKDMNNIILQQSNQIDSIDPANQIQSQKLTLAQATAIAQKSQCTKEGNLSSNSFYNPNSKTYWIDIVLNTPKPGCNPACVVSEETKQAEINWRCTGLNEKQTQIKEQARTTISQDCPALSPVYLPEYCPDGKLVGRSDENGCPTTPDCVR